MRRLLVVGSCLVTLATASCAAIFGFDRLSEGPGAADTGGIDGTSPAGDGGGDPACSVIGLPPPPSPDKAGGNLTVIGALRSLDFGISLDGGLSAAPGYNLDSTCSPTIDLSSCAVGVTASTYLGGAADKDHGVDNAAFGLLQLISRYSSTINTDKINAGVVAGLYGATVRVQNWNGLADDADVAVDVFPALGADGGLPDGGLAFDTTDNWIVDDLFRLAPLVDGSSQQSRPAYVSGGQLVATFKNLTIELIVGDDGKPFQVKLEDAILTGRISNDDGSFLAGGIVAGRWDAHDFLDEVRKIYVRNGNDILHQHICEGGDAATNVFDTVRTFTCDARDIRADSNDNKGLPCDAVSAAARIEGYRTRTYGTFAHFDRDTTCGDASPIQAGCP